MESIITPKAPTMTPTGKHTAHIEIKPCFPGYGATLGNAIRRVLLSSLEGYAITSVKIEGVEHEFSSIDGVLEDAVEVILNLKKLRFTVHSDEPTILTLKKKGEGKVTAADFTPSSDVEIVTPDAYIATITKKDGELNMEVEISKGIGYVPTEEREDEQKEIGKIHIDAIYTPVRKVSYKVSDMRVGTQTNYNKIEITLETDGSMSPEQAFYKTIDILQNQFAAIAERSEQPEPSEEQETEADNEDGKVAGELREDRETIGEETQEATTESLEDLLKKPVDQIGLSTRTSNALLEAGTKTVKNLTKRTEEQLLETEGLGKKAVKEIQDTLAAIGLSLKN